MQSQFKRENVQKKFLKKYFKNVAEVKIKSTFAVPIQTGKRSEKIFKKNYKKVCNLKKRITFAVPIKRVLKEKIQNKKVL